MCENFRKQFLENVMGRVGDETLLETLKKNYDFTYQICRNSKSIHHSKCKKYYLKLRTNVLGDVCDVCKTYFCETCYTTSFFNKPNAYTYEKLCFECLMKKEHFKPRQLRCPLCSNDDPSSFVYEYEFDAFFCLICRTKTSKSLLKPNDKTTELVSSGMSQDTATPLVGHYNIIINVAVGSGVVLPEPKKRYKITVVNKGTNNLNIYPSIGCFIIGKNVNAPIILSNFQSVTLIGDSNNSWEINN